MMRVLLKQLFGESEKKKENAKKSKKLKEITTFNKTTHFKIECT